MDNNKIAKIILIVIALWFLGPVIMFVTMVFPQLHISPWAIVLIIIGFIIAWAIATYNKLVSLNQKVNQAQGGIDVYLKQRFDLIPNLVETVKGYRDYEHELIENIARLRTDYDNRNEQDIKQSQNLNDRYTRLLAVVENYPELKASESFLKLQKMLSKIESQLQAARRIYNSEVTEFNTKIHTVPSNIIASMFGFTEKSLFEINKSERENIDINV